MILVTGATGNFGKSTAQYLQQKRIPFAAAARNLNALDTQYGGIAEIKGFDWSQPETFPQTLEGIRVVSLMPPPVVSNDFHKMAKPFVDAAKKTGVIHIVLTTALYSDNKDSIFFGTESLVKNSGVDFTIIRPSFVFQNFLNQFLASIQNGVIFTPSEKGKTSYVDIRNVGEATATVLANPSAHKGKTYVITGSEALSHSQMADIFTQRLGKKVVHISPSAEEYKEGLVKMNVPDFLHDFLAELYSTIAKGQWAHVSDDYTLLTGKSATTFNDFVEENRKIFLGTKEPAAAVAR